MPFGLHHLSGVPAQRATASSLVSVVLGIALLVAGCGAHGSPTSTATSLSTSTPFPTATVTPTQTPTGLPTLGAPWKSIGTLKYTSLDFLSGDPATIYGCSGTTQVTEPTAVDISHDGGATWHTLSTLPAGTNCDIRIDPFQPETIALVLFHCGGKSCATAPHPPANQFFRSTNGGTSWTEMKAPLSDGSFDDDIAWTQQGLFTVIDEQQHAGSYGPYLDVLASVNGAPFTIVSQNHGLVGQQISLVRQFAGVGATMYVGFDPPDASSIGLPAGVVAQSADNGATWSQVALKNGTGDVQFLFASRDGQRIIGRDVTDVRNQRLAYSANGSSWTLAPTSPSGLSYIFGLATVTPDGTMFAEFSNGPGSAATRKLYRAAAGASTWQVVQDLTTTGYQPAIIAVTWNAQGHPQTVWAELGFFPSQFYWIAL